DVVPCPFPEERALHGLVPIAFALQLGDVASAITAFVPPAVAVRVAPARAPAAWTSRVVLDLPIVVGRCALPRAAVARLGVRDVVTIERTLELVIGEGALHLAAAPGAMEARIASEYVRHSMALPDEAELELTVTLGTTKLALRTLVELTVGQIVPLGRPLAGPFELRAAGKLVGAGELVDIDGELGVRITRLD
ncbi:MAG: FliM/FliN family flagellar motor switch protein, partial [Proteobacteria bacterium]|nr:FliM/FliN family flagellar motor switch protein [Pseudomonadota bacterium]